MKPFVIDLTEKFTKLLEKFDGDLEKLKEFYKKFGYDKIPYDGIKRWGLDSSTESSDIRYEDIKEGDCLYWRRYTKNGFRWTLIEITHKYNGIIFFKTKGEKNNKVSYIDTGADDYSYNGNDSNRYTLPKHRFYPLGIIKPEWVDIKSWNAPKKMNVTNKK